jgi:large subunit ribosomal protein L4
MALSSKVASGQLVVLDAYPHITPKTKDFVKVLKNFDLNQALFITPEENRALSLSARNVPGVQVMLPVGLNVYDVLKYEHLVLLSPALEAIEARLAK